MQRPPNIARGTAFSARVSTRASVDLLRDAKAIIGRVLALAIDRAGRADQSGRRRRSWAWTREWAEPANARGQAGDSHALVSGAAVRRTLAALPTGDVVLAKLAPNAEAIRTSRAIGLSAAGPRAVAIGVRIAEGIGGQLALRRGIADPAAL